MKVNKEYLLIAAALVMVLITAGCEYTDFTDPVTWDLSSLPIIVIFTLLIPITALIAFTVLIYKLIKLRHARIMAMIAKGTYKPRPKDWRLILQLVGIGLIFLSPFAALMTMMEEGLSKGIASGFAALLAGIGTLVFRRVAWDYLPKVPKPGEDEESAQTGEHMEDTEKTK